MSILKLLNNKIYDQTYNWHWHMICVISDPSNYMKLLLKVENKSDFTNNNSREILYYNK